MTDQKYGVLTTAIPSRQDAMRIAHLLLQEKLAACVQLMPVHSLYTWKGQAREDDEILLLVKTRAALFEPAIQAIKAAHPYETPEIVAGYFAAGFAGYFAWIDEVTLA